MAGRPRQRAMIAALERRTRDTFEDTESTHIDYVCEWTESGRNLTELVAELTLEAKQGELSVGMLRRYLTGTWPNLDARLATARAAGAHAKVEDAQKIIDATTDDMSREALSRAKMKADVRLWHAERGNKADLGRGADVQVVINHNTLHLDAMRQRAVVKAELKLMRAPALEVTKEECSFVVCDEVSEIALDAAVLPRGED